MSEPTQAGTLDPRKPIDVRNIALALDCSTLNKVALETAVNLAAAMGANLRAVFIEDECLYSLAAMGFAREISFSGTRARSFSSEQISLDIKRSADAARAVVSAAARRARVKWAFDTTRASWKMLLRELGTRLKSWHWAVRAPELAGCIRSPRCGRRCIMGPACWSPR